MDLDQSEQIKQAAEGFFIAHPYLGWIVAGFFLLLAIAKFLISTIPAFTLIKGKILLPFARSIKINFLAKQAIDADITGRVNLAANKLQNELPRGWIKPLAIIWMERENKKSFFDDKKIVIRMNAVKDQKKNFILATYYYFATSLFPETSHILPDITRDSIAIRLAERVIDCGNDEESKKIFEDQVLEPAIKKQIKILDYMDKFKNLDKKGFLTGAYVREIDQVAEEVKAKPERKRIIQQTIEILNHIEKFATKGKNRPNELWSNSGPITRYGFLLVADEKKTKGGTQQYVNTASTDLLNGVKRLYIFGKNYQKNFVKKVISHIDKAIPEYKLIEIFDLNKDYSGQKGGIGAIFEAK
ncbi:MAG TPA: hypothetical protein PK398_00885 [Candidatus Gracilibacteria bacterium]|nr:hypothetical protein [Candidatus Gracilibacteria bacterium]